MADEQHDVGELWATVKGQGSAIAQLGTQVSEGFKAIQVTIADSHEKTDSRIRDLDAKTSAKIENVTQSWQQSSTQRSQSTLSVLGMILTGFIGFGGLITAVAGIAFTAYTLVKAPIDLSFGEIKAQLAATQLDVAANARKTEDKFESLRRETEAKGDAAAAHFMPKEQIEGSIKLFTDVTARNTTRIDDVEKGIVVGAQERADMRLDVKRLDDDVHALRDSVKQDFATRKETDVQFTDAQNRTNALVAGLNELRRQFGDAASLGDTIKQLHQEIDSNSRTLDTFRDNFVVIPSFPKYKQDGMAAPPISAPK